MPRVIYFHTDGRTDEVNAAHGETIMQAALNGGIDGIDADCGGAMACGTCHVYVQEPWLAKLPARSKEETDMLEGFASDVRPESRLSCQVKISDDLDGISVTVPARQGL